MSNDFSTNTQTLALIFASKFHYLSTSSDVMFVRCCVVGCVVVLLVAIAASVVCLIVGVFSKRRISWKHIMSYPSQNDGGILA